ncbi:AsnC family transcriptional regulator [Marinobacterium iners]|jgi:Lrp/AsnC family leucine-responsive transcriptional regulator|uniref:Leucine-responsive regulatory protein n=1 Tax=Marinobacterium iners DSM 11526 TaxID=1122198 RepID=A0A1H4C3F0_9GAMM|nr:Lrp/AsnC ligand binding domain-containing protein [Marinobacterium iners]QSR35959.1 AsnC family transcriptional regulator [Marinobacterium iners]SEA54975.1 transcriptional regulator, AsnC family [Marinobacterium iners DSM 11526]
MAQQQKVKKIDRIDRNILTILQQEGRISYTELADRVGLSTTPCMERVKRLERDGFITGYHASVNPQMLNYNLLVFVEIALSYQSPDAFERFNRAVSTLPYILECHLVSGDADYLLKARLHDMSQYRELLGDMLLTLPGVKNSKSYIVMEEVKEQTQLPVDIGS